MPEEWLRRWAGIAGVGETTGDHVRFKMSQVALLDAALEAQPAISVDERFARVRDELASFSGIAQPESFEQSLVKLGAELVYAKRYADHHRFTQQEVLNAINRSKKRQAAVILTTQKDAVRFPKIDRRDLPIIFMRVEIKILSGAKDFHDCVRQICFR